MKHLSNHGRNAEFKCAYCDYSVSMRHTLDVHQYFHTRNGKGLSGQLKAVEKKDFDDSNAEIDSYFNDLRILAGDIKLETTSPKITVDTTMIDSKD